MYRRPVRLQATGKRRRAILIRRCLILFIVGNAFAARSNAQEFHLLSSWSPAYIGRPEIAGRFVEQLHRRTAGGIKVRITGPEAIPPFEQLQPTAVGVVDLLFTHGAYHMGETAVGMALDAVQADPQARRTGGIWQAVDDHYRSHGLKLLALPTSARGYQILLRDGIGAQCDLRGRKIRGTPVYQGLIRSLSAAPVVLPAGEIYAALEKHVIDGAAWPAAGSLPFRWYEVTNYYVRPTFGTTTHLLLMNLERFEALDLPQRRLLLEEGERLEIDVHDRFDALVELEEQAFEQFGLRATPPCKGPLARLAQSWADGVWSLAIMKSGSAARELRNLADDAGLTESHPE